MSKGANAFLNRSVSASSSALLPALHAFQSALQKSGVGGGRMLRGGRPGHACGHARTTPCINTTRPHPSPPPPHRSPFRRARQLGQHSAAKVEWEALLERNRVDQAGAVGQQRQEVLALADCRRALRQGGERVGDAGLSDGTRRQQRWQRQGCSMRSYATITAAPASPAPRSCSLAAASPATLGRWVKVKPCFSAAASNTCRARPAAAAAETRGGGNSGRGA